MHQESKHSSDLRITTPLKAVIVNGKDSTDFLNRLVISDLNHLSENLPFSGICNPKGRLLYTFWLIPSENDGFILFADPALLDELLRFLSMRVFRSQVKVETEPNLQLRLQTANDDSVLTQLVHSGTSLQKQPPEIQQKLWDDYWLWLMQHHLPWIQPSSQGLFIPQHLDLHHHGVVSVDKGCYPGQEIIARLHFLGKNKKHLYHVHLPYNDKPPTLPPVGSDLRGCDGNALFTLACPTVATKSPSKELVFQMVGTHSPDCLIIENHPTTVVSNRPAIVKNCQA